MEKGPGSSGYLVSHLLYIIVLNEAHLRRILAGYFDYYHRSRTHLSLGRNAPLPRQVQPPHLGRVIARRPRQDRSSRVLKSSVLRYRSAV